MGKKNLNQKNNIFTYRIWKDVTTNLMNICSFGQDVTTNPMEPVLLIGTKFINQILGWPWHQRPQIV